MILAFEFCSDPGVLQVIYIIKTIIKLVTFIIPIALIFLVMVDFLQGTAVSAKKSKDILPISVRRIVAALLVFFVPMMVNLTLDLISSSGKSDVIASVGLAENSIKNCWQYANPEGVADARTKQDEEDDDDDVVTPPPSSDPIQIIAGDLICGKKIEAEKLNIHLKTSSNPIYMSYDLSYGFISSLDSYAADYNDLLKNRRNWMFYYNSGMVHINTIASSFISAIDRDEILGPTMPQYLLRNAVFSGGSTIIRGLYLGGFSSLQNNFDYSKISNNDYVNGKLSEIFNAKGKSKFVLTDHLNDESYKSYYIFGKVTLNGSSEKVIGIIDTLSNSDSSIVIKFYSTLLGGHKYIYLDGSGIPSDAVSLDSNYLYKSVSTTISFGDTNGRVTEYITTDELREKIINSDFCNAIEYKKYLKFLNGETVTETNDNFNISNNINLTAVNSDGMKEYDVCGKTITFSKNASFGSNNFYQSWLQSSIDKGYDINSVKSKYLLLFYGLNPILGNKIDSEFGTFKIFESELSGITGGRSNQFLELIQSNNTEKLKLLLNNYIYHYLVTKDSGKLTYSLRYSGVFNYSESIFDNALDEFNKVGSPTESLKSIIKSNYKNTFILGKYTYYRPYRDSSEYDIVGLYDNDKIVFNKLGEQYSIPLSKFTVSQDGKNLTYKTDTNIYEDNITITFNRYFTLDGVLNLITNNNVCNSTQLNNFLANYDANSRVQDTNTNTPKAYAPKDFELDLTKKMMVHKIKICGRSKDVNINSADVNVSPLLHTIKLIIESNEVETINGAYPINLKNFVKYYTSNIINNASRKSTSLEDNIKSLIPLFIGNDIISPFQGLISYEYIARNYNKCFLPSNAFTSNCNDSYRKKITSYVFDEQLAMAKLDYYLPPHESRGFIKEYANGAALVRAKKRSSGDETLLIAFADNRGNLYINDNSGNKFLLNNNDRYIDDLELIEFISLDYLLHNIVNSVDDNALCGKIRF